MHLLMTPSSLGQSERIGRFNIWKNHRVAGDDGPIAAFCFKYRSRGV
jgi:hypothetical protein